MSDLDKRLNALSPAQRALLQKRLKLTGLDTLSDVDQTEAPPIQQDAATATLEPAAATAAPQAQSQREMGFSLLFFSDNGAASNADKYRLLIECAKRADHYNFAGIWTPERHFHPFGGLYPNPSVLGAALAMITERLQIRAGSVVLPLHNPIRVAEEWSVVDNLSKGRVSLAFASGWSMDDFVFAPDAYTARKEVMIDSIRTMRRLWAGETITERTSNGKEIELQIFPKPLQPELAIWLSSAGNAETFIKAGEIGAHVLTSLIGQTVDQLGEKIALYRESLARHGYDPNAYKVALMLHTFVGDELSTVKEQVRQPMYDYLRTNLGLHANLAKRRNTEVDLERFTDQDEAVLLEHAFERYFNGSALLGTPSSCMAMIERLRRIDVDEVACLMDFGVDLDMVIAGIDHLNELKERANRRSTHEPAVSDALADGAG